MAHFVLQIAEQHKAREMRGSVVKTIGFDAGDDHAALSEAARHLGTINWDTHFAALQSDDGKFVSFWTKTHERKNKQPKPMNPLVTFGIWAWGTVTALLAFAIIAILVVASLYMTTDGRFAFETPRSIAGLYFVLKDSGALIGGIVGLSGLAWAHFFQVKPQPNSEKDDSG